MQKELTITLKIDAGPYKSIETGEELNTTTSEYAMDLVNAIIRVSSGELVKAELDGVLIFSKETPN